ncbi:Glycosyl hydrolase family 115 [Dyadobacter sp. SG02]|uniref:glycosyl hydrolase 115 family protein n=1 Tax=Dyadobacter sp. SG02 TaxID=1855291 RepID=UPI0008B93436|nr:glycosyl hydrolase 115 family protein [Dyadobacter sp. SG02]SEJ36435.1 Glycosyl hydrolase family 115 [Dyadobacter sp. SG02]
MSTTKLNKLIKTLDTKQMRCWVSILILLLFFGTNVATAQEIILRGKVPVYIHPEEPAPVRKAVTDLLRDLNNVFGQPSQVVDKLPESGPVIVVATGTRYEGSQKPVSGWEAHQVYADHGRVILNGADMRGTIYAVYSFSELVLGVKPLWFWTSEKPAKKGKVLIAADYLKAFSSPYVKYRAWLPNDTDFLTPWQKLSAENYEAFYETMLRLKLNTLEGSIADKSSFTAPFPAGKDATIGQRRGLITTGHHMQIFGSNYSNWADYWQKIRKLPVPELKIANRDALKEWWAYHIDLAVKNKLDVIWLVGFRGNRDIPFWEFFPDAPTDPASRAKVIDEMVHIQIDLLKEKIKDPHPPMRLTLYNEMSTLVAGGFFKLPDEPSLIRNFVAARRDHFPAADVRSHQFSGEPAGYYMNFQFTSTGSHLAQAEGPRKMQQNFRMVDSLSGNKLIFSVVNAGNMREHLLELSANAEMMWNFKTFKPEEFLKSFSANYFGDPFGAEIGTLYTDFFNSYWQQKKGDLPGFERQYLFQDMRYARAMEMLLNDLEKGKYSVNPLDNHPMDNPDKGSVGYFRVIPADNAATDQLDALLKGTTSSIAKLEAVTARADGLYAKIKQGRHFFDDNLRGQAYLMLHLNRSLQLLTLAYQKRDDKPGKRQLIGQSLDEIHLAQQRLHQSEHDQFAGWYANDTKFGMKNIEQRLTNLYKQLTP